MASFSASAKSEICCMVPQDREGAAAECFGVLLFCSSFRSDGIRIVTESRDFGKLLVKLFKRAFSMSFDAQPEEDSGGKQIFRITDPEKLRGIFETYGLSGPLHLNLPVVEEPEHRAAFLRGAFLAGGSVTDPGKGYHLELATTHQSVARECDALIREEMGFAPKTAARSGGTVLYFKQSDRISDFLTYLGAPVAAMGLMEAKLEKELNNRVNRCCNCDDANITKIVMAAQEQLAAIRNLKDRGLFQNLPEKLRQAAKAREEHPDAGLTELAEMMDPPITKPAMSHRLRRLVTLSEEAEE